jgi:hypothetical protein
MFGAIQSLLHTMFACAFDVEGVARSIVGFAALVADFPAGVFDVTLLIR